MSSQSENPGSGHNESAGPAMPLYIVGIGASAGGVEALERLFAAIPPDTPLAFVVVQHLSPDFESMMDELLARHTSLTIHTVEDGVQVQPGSIYLIPPRKEMIISGGHLLLTDKEPTRGLTLPIDQFLRSLAQDQGERAVGVILSGTGSDGSRGIRDIHDAGGLVLVQDETTARFDGMPRSAIETGVVDLVLSPEKIAETLTKFARHPVRDELAAASASPPVDEGVMHRLLRLLRDAHGIDFALYKPTTVGRRIERRLLMNHASSFDSYVDHVEQNPGELESLYHDLLIGVTKFFRDEQAFARLENEVIPELLRNNSDRDEIRVWVAGCATGEEAYSIAILLHEQLTAANRPLNVKLFATDVHQPSLEIASAGVYSASSLGEMSAERIERYFSPNGESYEVLPELRQMIVFAPHNIVKDAPFTKLDLITCRNLLIYLQPNVQKKAISLFHFGLKTGGLLWLGPSEGVGELDDEFVALDRHWKLFRKRRDVRLPTDLRLPISTGTGHLRSPRLAPPTAPEHRVDAELACVYEQIVTKYVSSAVLCDIERRLVHVFGPAADILKIRPGRVSSDILDLVDSNMKMALSGAIQRASVEGTPVSYSGISVETPQGPKVVRLSVTPLRNREGEVSYLLIALDETEDSTPAVVTDCDAIDFGEVSRERIAYLETQLKHTRENLQATIEELETSNEELHSTNEELVASNEELQSTNEELHSVNEELYTVNAEYQRKIAELTELTDDMNNLLASTEIGTVFLDTELCIRRITPQVARLFNILPQDIGRPIEHFTHNLEHGSLLESLNQVLATGDPFEQEIKDRFGKWHFLRVRPYRAQTGIEGVVLTIVDIQSLKDAEEALREQDRRLQGILDNSPSFIFIKDLDGHYLMANGPAQDVLGVACEQVLGHTDYDFLPQQIADRIQSYERDVVSNGESRTVDELVGADQRVWLAVRYALRDDDGRISAVAGIYSDVTALKEAEQRAREGVRQRDRFLAVLSHELRNPLASISTSVECLSRLHDGSADMTSLTGVLRRQSDQLSRLTDDLLDLSRIDQGRIELRRRVFDLCEAAEGAAESIRSLMTERDIQFSSEIPNSPVYVWGDPARLQQVIVNLLVNAGKYTPSGGSVRLALKSLDKRAVVCVEDDGVGLTRELLQTVFEPFVQADDTLDRSDGGMGIGLTLVRSLVMLHEGDVSVESDGPGRGSRFTVSLPMSDREPTTEPEGGHQSAETTHLRLLLVEDNDDARNTLRMLLEMDGYEVRTAADGMSGVQAILEHRPDVALIDIGLPQIDGYEVARRVRAELPDADQVHLVALTGYGHAKDKRRAREAGFDSHFTKPLKVARLHELLVQLAQKATS